MIYAVLALIALLVAEDLIFRFALKKDGFLAFTYEKSFVFQYAFYMFFITAVPYYALRVFLHTDGTVIPAVVSAVLGGAVALYYFIIKKDRQWYFALTLAVNAPAADLVFGSSDLAAFAPDLLVYSLVSGVFTVIAVFAFAGVKDNFRRFRRDALFTALSALCLVLLTAIACYGLYIAPSVPT